jgi:SAM-dependent methyltransferase
MTEMANNENLCPACLSNGKLRYPEKLEDNLFNDLTFASRKRPELMHYDLFECENCKTLFTNRNVNLSQLLKNYEIAEYDSNVEAKYAAKTYVKNLQKALPKFKGSILDIGAGDGAFLSAAQGVLATSNLGIEPSIKAIAKNDDNRVNIKNIAIEDLETNEKFDLVTCFQTIEHLNSPREFITNIKRFIKPGGYFAISCHNRLSLTNKILGEKSPIFDVEHLQVFTDQGIEKLFSGLNFKIVYSNKYRNKYPLSYWLKIAPVGEKIKDFVETKKKLFGLGISINVGNHMIVGRLD